MPTDEPIPQRLVWFDAEFTSLEPEQSRLLQVAMVVTDTELKRVLPPEDDLNLVIRLPDEAEVSPWVAENLADLIQACRGPGALSEEEVDRTLAEVLLRACGGRLPESIKARPVLSGNSVYNDAWMARRWLPSFAAGLHYRLLDVSSIKILWQVQRTGEIFDKEDPALIKRWLPEAPELLDGRPHDAYYDILASMAELAFYKARMMAGSSGMKDET